MNLSQKIATWVACVLAAIYGIFCVLVFVYPKPFFYNPTRFVPISTMLINMDIRRVK